MKKYEIMYILRSTLEEKVSKTDEWGLKDLAYEIKKEKKGYYVVLKVEAEPAALKEFDRLTKIDNNVLRYLITVDHQ